MIRIKHEFDTNKHCDWCEWISDIVLNHGGDGDCLIISDDFTTLANKFDKWRKNQSWFCDFKKEINDKYIIFFKDQESIVFSNQQINENFYNIFWIWIE